MILRTKIQNCMGKRSRFIKNLTLFTIFVQNQRQFEEY